jgi:hypothetical protein
MKKHLLLLTFAFIALTVCGQSSIPNGDFETWITKTNSFPENYPYTSSAENGWTFISNDVPFNVTKASPGYHGSYALSLSTVVVGADSAAGYALNCEPNGDDPFSWHGGFPYTQKPTGLKGYYKYNVPATTDLNGDEIINSNDYPDLGLIIVAFSKEGRNIGTYFLQLGGDLDAFTPFNKTFDPALTETPDSVIIGASSSYAVLSDGGAGVIGATLVLDSIAFTDVTSQPDLMNGDFEEWRDSTIDYLSGWNPNTEHSRGVYKTAERVDGLYAVGIKTYLGETNDHAAAESGQLSTGYWDESNSYQSPLGGNPFSNQIDTLAFYYKYTPSGDDVAQVSLYFKTEESLFNQNGWYSSLTLDASNDFKYVELPFDLGFTPDSVIIMIESSYWADTLLTYVGSDLIMDDVHFKSQPLSSILLNPEGSTISLSPNPATNAFQVNGLEGTASLSILNIGGDKVYSKDISAKETIPTNALPDGAYIVVIKSNGVTKKIKLIVQKEK